MSDLISRESAIDAMYMGCYLNPKDRGDLIKALERLPTIDAVPVKHGEWLPYEFCTDGTWDKCSVCGVAHRTRSKYIGFMDQKEHVIQDRMNYCPICGAKMDGERKDDEHTD